jgi:hypothetical protein
MTTQSIVRTRLTLTMPLRWPGLYVAPSSLAITPSPESSQGSAFFGEVVSGVTSTDPEAVFLRPGAAAIIFSSAARRSAKGFPVSICPSSASRSKARKSAGVCSASMRTRDSAGCRRFWSASNSSRPSVSRMTSSPSST